MIVEPVPAILRPPLSPTAGVSESLSMWGTVARALRIGRRAAVVEVLLPRTLPVLMEDDLTPYHIIEGSGKPVLRKGAPPQAVAEAAADFAMGALDLNGFLDRIGVPQR